MHALDPQALHGYENLLRERRISILPVPEVVDDLYAWYQTQPRRAGLRHCLVGDVWHLLVGYCGYGPADP